MDGQASARAERVVAGRYELRERVGSGGMGVVWRAHDTVLGREVALKEVHFPPGLPDSERDLLRERTRREARAAARLDHPSAVTVFDVVEHDGAPCIVMELVDGRSLADVVRSDGPLSPARVAEIGVAVLGALEAAHRRGIVHRDVKPGNVLLGDDGRVVLTDFGIATSSGDSSLTSAGTVLGSPAYIAPERARGEQPGPAADLWALGATLFTAVEGRAPYGGADALATVTAVITDDRAPLTVEGPLAPVIEGLLEREPARRLSAPQARELLQQVPREAPARTTAAVPVAGEIGDTTQVLPVGRAAPTAPPAVAPPAAPPARPAAPPPPATRLPAPPRPAPRRSSRAVPVALSALLLGGTAVGVGALLLADDRSDRTTAQTSPGASQPASEPSFEPPATAEQDPSRPEQVEPTERAEQPAAGQPADGPEPPPAGWTSSTGGPGWTVSVPPSWQAGSFEGQPEWRAPGTGRTVRISTTGPGGGKDDAVQDRRDQAEAFAASHDDYREIAIEPIDYRGYEAADWEFTYTGAGGTPVHALSRVFVVDGRGYSLFFQTRAADDWSAAREDFEQISRSFVPA